MGTLDDDPYLNLTRATVLLIENSQHAVDLLAQIMKSFGVFETYRCMSIHEAEKIVMHKTIDLIVMEPDLADGHGHHLIRRVRRELAEPLSHIPIVLIRGHARAADIAETRDLGVNFIIAKPITPQILLQRILWVVKDKRPFVKCGHYVDPDRRFKFEGPPIGSTGRRNNDLTDPLSQAADPNMSQNEIDMMLKPQRVVLS